MSADAQMIAEAIRSLKDDGGVSDYVIAFGAALLGGCAGFLAIKYQRYKESQIEKLGIANKWVLEIKNAFDNLVILKRNISVGNRVHPFHRAQFQRIFIDFTRIQLPLSELSFLVGPIEEEDQENQRWRNVARISEMKANYNMLLTVLERRNDLYKEMTSKAEVINPEYKEKGQAGFNWQAFVSTVGINNAIELLTSTEAIIVLTDGLIRETYDFSLNFGRSAKYCINMELLGKHFGNLISIAQSSADTLELLKSSPDVDWEALHQYTGEDASGLKIRFKTGYEDIYYPPPIEETMSEENRKVWEHNEAIKIRKNNGFWWWN